MWLAVFLSVRIALFKIKNIYKDNTYERIKNQNIEIPIANLVFEQYAKKYTEIRIGSKDGIAIGRLVMYGVNYFSWNEHDKNGQYIRTHHDYFSVCTQGEALDVRITRVALELLPNVTEYTDSKDN